MSFFPEISNPDEFVISPLNASAMGMALNAMGLTIASSTFVTANRAFLVPVSIVRPVTVVKMFVSNGSTVAGNIDVGIYTDAGVRVVSSGSTAQSGTSDKQEFDITDTPLNPGLYYLAVASDSATATIDMWSPTTSIARLLGVCEMASAFPLPSTVTFATLTSSRIPFIGATQKVTI